jgi:hypothetical protein
MNAMVPLVKERMDMARKTVAELLVDVLAEAGVERSQTGFLEPCTIACDRYRQHPASALPRS